MRVAACSFIANQSTPIAQLLHECVCDLQTTLDAALGPNFFPCFTRLPDLIWNFLARPGRGLCRVTLNVSR